jgi:uncharacterized protein (TIGR00106 family)
VTRLTAFVPDFGAAVHHEDERRMPESLYNEKERQMKVIIELGVVPIGVGVSVSKYVAACQRVVEEAGLEHQLHAYGTNIQGEWDDVFAAVKRCHEVVHEMGAPRIFTVLKVGTRTDREQTMNDKIKSVESKLGNE